MAGSKQVISRLSNALGRDERGTMAVIMAMMLSVMLLSVGGAIDFLRWHQARLTTTAAVDAAVLAAGRALIMHPSDAQDAATIANNVYRAAIADRVPVISDTIRFTVDAVEGSVVANGSASMQTTILSTVGFNELGLVSTSGTDLARAEVSPGGPGGSNLEVAVMLDVTGSMCGDGVGPCLTGTKIDGLKAAATDLVNIVVKADQSQFTSKVALVPFATKIRLAQDGGGAAMMKTLTNLDATWSGLFHDCTASSGGGGSETNGDWTCTAYADIPVIDWKVMPCVTERYFGGAFDLTDDAPGAGHWLNAHDGSRRQLSNDSSDTPLALGDGTGVAGDPAVHWNFRPDGYCGDIAEGNDIQPLTSNKATLIARINALQGYGGTAGALGTSWAWYMLSPNWNSVWTGESVPGSYAELAATSPGGAPALRKVAVLMTDGGFNAFRSGKGQDQQMVSDHAVSVCIAMKALGIEVYTVGFALDQLTSAEATIARATLTACGTDVSHFYETLDVPQLRTAFQSIGSHMAGLRLTR